MQRRFSATSHSLTKQHHQYKTEDTRLISGAAMTCWLSLYQKWSIANTNTYTNPIPIQPGAALANWWTPSQRWSTASPGSAPTLIFARCDAVDHGYRDWKQTWMKKLLNYLNVFLFQAHQDILSCSRNGLNACFKPAEVLLTINKTWRLMKTSLQSFWNNKVEAILTVQKAELRTATETVNIFEKFFITFTIIILIRCSLHQFTWTLPCKSSWRSSSTAATTSPARRRPVRLR